MPARDQALPGRAFPIPTATEHAVLHRPLKGPYPPGLSMAMFGMGCFWDAERKFWQLGDGIHVTAAGYAAGFTQNPTYKEVCSGQTGHSEVVLVVYDSKRIPYEMLLKIFWENHDPTQSMRQGVDVGTMYRSGIYTFTPEQKRVAEASRDIYQAALKARGFDNIVTEIKEASEFYFAEDYHQQFMHKNPGWLCSAGHTGVSCPIGLNI